MAMHHPPFTTIIGHMDKIGMQAGLERLKAIISRHPNVERIICGHLHRVFGWSPPEGLVTHLAFLGPYDGPYPFRENGKLIDKAF